MKTRHPRLLAVALSLLCLGQSASQAQNRNTVPLYTVPVGTEVREVCASGDYAYVARGSAGIEVVKISGIGAPANAGNIRPYAGQGNICIQDVQVVGNILYVANDVPNGGPTPFTGLFMYDLSANPVAPTLVGTLTWGAGPLYHLGGSVHNLAIDVAAGRTYAYLASAISNCVEVFDVTNPAVPEFKDTLLSILPGSRMARGTVHDIAVKNGKCASSWTTAGFAVHDVSNIANSSLDLQTGTRVSATSLINNTRYASAMTYHVAFSADGNTLLTADGRYYIGCRTWDLSTITAPTTPLVYSAQYTSGTTAFIHNIHVEGKYIYLSNFLDGLRIVELLPGNQMRDMGRYDTTPTTAGSSQSGAFGVCVTGQQVLISDTQLGLVSVDFRDTITVPLAEWKQSTQTLTIESTSSASPSVGLNVAGFGTMTWNVSTGKYRLVMTGVTANPLNVNVVSDIGGLQSAPVRRR